MACSTNRDGSFRSDCPSGEPAACGQAAESDRDDTRAGGPDTVIDLLLSEQQRISTIYFMMSEENVRLQLRQPWIKISTDGAASIRRPNDAGASAAYGTYTRVRQART
jgi:hypothetical protein